MCVCAEDLEQRGGVCACFFFLNKFTLEVVSAYEYIQCSVEKNSYQAVVLSSDLMNKSSSLQSKEFPHSVLLVHIPVKTVKNSIQTQDACVRLFSISLVSE